MKAKSKFFSILLTIFSLSAFGQITDSNYSHNTKTPGTVVINKDSRIDKLTKIKFSETNHSNYKIQLYYGNLEKAHSVLSKFKFNFNQWPGKIEYETPNYKVWIGNFEKRLEADKALMKINKKFPHAFIFKPEIKKTAITSQK